MDEVKHTMTRRTRSNKKQITGNALQYLSSIIICTKKAEKKPKLMSDLP